MEGTIVVTGFDLDFIKANRFSGFKKEISLAFKKDFIKFPFLASVDSVIGLEYIRPLQSSSKDGYNKRLFIVDDKYDGSYPVYTIMNTQDKLIAQLDELRSDLKHKADYYDSILKEYDSSEKDNVYYLILGKIEEVKSILNSL